VPQEQVESEVIAGLASLLNACADVKGFTHSVNEELRRIWEESVGCDPAAPKKLKEIDAKIANIRKAIEDGLADAAWANARLPELLAERERIQATPPLNALNTLNAQYRLGDTPPRIDPETVRAYRRDTEKILAHGDPTEQKRILRAWVDDIKLAPEALSVETTYRIPEPIQHSVVAGAC
jgi:hypothetical protein